MEAYDEAEPKQRTQLKGIDPAWQELDTEFATLMVNAPCEKVVDVLKGRKGVSKGTHDLRSDAVCLDDDGWGRAVFVFQLAGHDWTQVSGPYWWLGPADLAASLSRRLRCTVLQNLGEGVYYGFNTHLRFENGKQIEDDREAEEVATELGMYIAYDAWEDDGGRVVSKRA